MSPTANIIVKVHSLLSLFFLPCFGVLCDVIFKSVLKSIFSIISAAGFMKKSTNTSVLFVYFGPKYRAETLIYISIYLSNTK